MLESYATNGADLMTLSEAARFLRVAEATLRAMADGGRVPVTRTESGRRIFYRKDVEAARVARDARRAA